MKDVGYQELVSILAERKRTHGTGECIQLQGVRLRSQSRLTICFSWLCMGILLLINSAEAVHFCEFRAGLKPVGANVVQASVTDHSEPTLCVICANSHSPWLSESSAQLSPIGDSNEFALAVPISEHFNSPLFGLHVRPPPSL